MKSKYQIALDEAVESFLKVMSEKYWKQNFRLTILAS